jgi:hypothetical protein
MSAEKPVRLTLPAYDIGAADMLAGGRSVGFCLDEGGGTRGHARRWRAYLYLAAQDRRMPKPEGCEEVTAGTLGELRRELRERIALKGPWWA